MSGNSNARVVVFAASGVAGVLVLSGCSTITSLLKSGSDAVIQVLPSDGADSDVPAHSPIVVRAKEGKLVAVKVRGPEGLIPGTLHPNGSRWVSKSSALDFGAKYRVSARAVDERGETAHSDQTFQTILPAQMNDAELKFVGDGDEMGVGMPLRIEFPEPVENRAEVEKNIKIRSSKPVTGAWSWSDDGKVVTFRPRKFWPSHNMVALDAGLKGVETSPGVFGEDDINAELTVGARVISTVDVDTLEMEVESDGEVLNYIPVTTGKYGFETRSGIKPIMAKEGTVVMDAASGGTSRNSSEYYRLTVHQSMRLTWSGEYVHSAPWSTGSQGRRNVSHGCIGMSSGNAAWFYDMANVGDVVVVENSGREHELGNGITDWHVPWTEWLAKSATGAVEIPGTLPAPKKFDENEEDETS